MFFIFINDVIFDSSEWKHPTMLPDKDGPGSGGGQVCPEGEDSSVTLFREYLRLRTVHPKPDYGEMPLVQ